MYSTSIIKSLNTRNILSLVSEYDIFKRYIGYDFEIGRSIISPLRNEKNPSFSIYRSQYGVYDLRYRDFVNGDTGTCFDLVMKLHSCDFMTALRIIDRDFNLGINDYSKPLAVRAPKIEITAKSTESCRISVGIRDWDNRDRMYWTQYGITCKTLIKYQVYPLSHFYVGSLGVICKDITYGYYFGNEKWKIYSPYNLSNRWYSNTSFDIIQGFDQLPAINDQSDVLVLTKALKDVILYHEVGIPAIAPQSETVILRKEAITKLLERFKTIIVNLDYDYAGIRSGNVYKRLYGFKCFYFTNGRLGTTNYNSKDAADYVKNYGIEKFKELLNNVRSTLK